MKIEIGAYTLIAGGEQSPEDLQVGADALVQIAQGLRAATARVFHRGNQTITLQFQVTRTYASAAAVEAALFSHPGEVPTEGDITITCEPCDETATVVTLADATLHAFAATQIGLSIRWRYTITAGAVDVDVPA